MRTVTVPVFLLILCMPGMFAFDGHAQTSTETTRPAAVPSGATTLQPASSGLFGSATTCVSESEQYEALVRNLDAADVSYRKFKTVEDAVDKSALAKHKLILKKDYRSLLESYAAFVRARAEAQARLYLSVEAMVDCAYSIRPDIFVPVNDEAAQKLQQNFDQALQSMNAVLAPEDARLKTLMNLPMPLLYVPFTTSVHTNPEKKQEFPPTQIASKYR